jgi:hypothetical protein
MRRELSLIALALGLGLAVIIRDAGGALRSELHLFAVLVSVALILGGVTSLLRSRAMKTADVPIREREEHDPTRGWIALLTRGTLALTLVVVPVAIVDMTVAAVVLALGVGVIAVSWWWHWRATPRRGVPKSERWRLRHTRTFESPFAAEEVLARAEELLRHELGARVERLGEGELAARTPSRRWVSGQEITIRASDVAESRSCVTVQSRPIVGAVDGGASWLNVSLVRDRLQ